MAKCDLCGDACDAHKLEQVLPQYQVDGVVDVCPACSKWATATKYNMLGEISARMREAIRARRGVVKMPWWRRWSSR